MVERRVSRRAAARGDRASSAPAAALAPIIAACSAARRQPVRGRSGRVGGASAAASAAAERGGQRAEPTPVPEPEAELFVYNWTEYIGEDTIPTFEDEVRRQGHLRLLLEHRRGLRQARRRRRRLRRLVPDLGRHPGLHREGRARRARPVADPEPRRTWARSGRTRATTRATSTRCRTCGGRRASATTPAKITDTLTSSKALWDPRFDKHIAMLDEWQEVLRAGADPARLRREHERHSASSTRRSRCSSSRSRWSAYYRPTPARR